MAANRSDFSKQYVNKGSAGTFTFLLVPLPSATSRILSVLIMLAHDRRRIVHFNVTDLPTAEWTAQQIVEAIDAGASPCYRIRDRDGVYRLAFRGRAEVDALHACDDVHLRTEPSNSCHASNRTPSSTCL